MIRCSLKNPPPRDFTPAASSLFSFSPSLSAISPFPRTLHIHMMLLIISNLEALLPDTHQGTPPPSSVTIRSPFEAPAWEKRSLCCLSLLQGYHSLNTPS